MSFDPSRRLFLRNAALVSIAPIVVPPAMGPLEKVIKYFFAPSGGWGVAPVGNTFLSPTMITRETLRILHKHLYFDTAMSNKFDEDFWNANRIGSTITIRTPKRFTVS